MKIIIITGGSSSERKISLISARAVKKALERRHSVKLFDFKKGFTSLKNILGEFDVVFPVMHGEEGEDGTLYRFLHSAGKPYVGSHPKGAKIAFEKILFKKYCDIKSFATASWKIVKTKKDILEFGFPCVLKGSRGGSSHEVLILHSKKDLSNPRVKKILGLPCKIYVEQLLEGVEITVGILNNEALPVLEITLLEGGWFDYKNKYSGKTSEIPFAPSLKKNIQKQAQAIALNIHRDLNLGSYSRADFIVKNDVPYILEINTPSGVGLTSESLLPKSAKAIGLNFEELVERMLP